ncbi:PucR C-terminal helix-turn-helix domain-containing protein [Actinacidiphila bryophytorum]|uniref:PucR C-terminal helix-turn-helix domain-containing protein n=1 Tax=Actinacidiphila bryophytorum TaxID=1436133 RepID=A0A9W4H153_9ACTN|nr:PucR C-terminal helix-turn-helix domain-containing protein [Actinacidiphila bryophytorum]
MVTAGAGTPTGTGGSTPAGTAPVPAEFLAGFPETLAEVSRSCRALTRAERESRRALGEQAADAGIGLRELTTVHLAAARRAWGSLPGVAGARDTAELRSVGAAVLGAIEAGVGALAEGHARAQRHAVRRAEAARRAFVDDLLYGRSDPGRIAEQAEGFGLRLAERHVVAVAAHPPGEPYDDAHPLLRRIERELAGRFGDHDALIAPKDGRLVCVAPTGQRQVFDAFVKLACAPDGTRVAVSRPHSGAVGVVRSYEEALSALDLAERLALDGRVLNAADLLVFPVLMRDRAAMTDLVQSVLGPLATARGGAEPLLATISAYAAAGYVNAEAARRLDLSVRALSYRLERIAALTGFDPDDPLQRYTLETAAMGARLLGWPPP